jgi:haloalkane dehalogenase
MEALRTPDDRFARLPGYPFAPRYVEVEGLRIHYVDEGPRDAAPVLLLHGEPSWSYLYRKMIPVITAAGQRAIAPDLVGFGRSDKPVRREDYTYQRHVDWMRGVLERLDLRRVTLVCQDWGGLIGLRLAAEHPERFGGIVAANTFLPTGDRPAGSAFLAWRKYSQETPDFHVGGIVKGGCVTDLAPEIVAAYDAPFPDDRYKAGARQFPMLVPVTSDDPAAAPNRRAWEALGRWTKPFLTAFSDSDPITGGADRILQQAIPGARGQAHRTIGGAGPLPPGGQGGGAGARGGRLHRAHARGVSR